MARRTLARLAVAVVVGVAMAGCGVLMGMAPLTVGISGACWFGAAMFVTAE